MKNRKRISALLLALALTVSLCACDGVTEGPTGGTANPDPSQDYGAVSSQSPGTLPYIEADLTKDAVAFSAGLSPNDVLLTVNGEDVTADLFLYWLFWDCYYFEYSYSFYGLTVADFAETLLEDTVDMALYYTVLRQRATELGCLPTDAQMQEARDELLAEGEAYYEGLKTANGLSDESFTYLTTISYYYDNLLEILPMPTQEELAEYLDTVNAFSVKHILLMTTNQITGAALDKETVAAKKALAEDLLSQLQAVEGEDQLALFDALMNTYSEDSGLAYNPDGYVFTDNDSLVGGFREAAMELEPGEISGIVETDYGYHILLRCEVDHPEDFADDCQMYQLELELDALADAAKFTRADALDHIDVADFYERYFVYQNAVMEQFYDE